jgi:outer membrane biosynthesis protein TonB
VDGFIRELKVSESPNAELGKAASDAIRQWQFEPTLLNCVPVEIAFSATVRFTAGKVSVKGP